MFSLEAFSVFSTFPRYRLIDVIGAVLLQHMALSLAHFSRQTTTWHYQSQKKSLYRCDKLWVEKEQEMWKMVEAEHIHGTLGHDRFGEGIRSYQQVLTPALEISPQQLWSKPSTRTTTF